MPGLVLFRRRWAISSDDIVVPGVLLLVYHLTLTGIFIAILDATNAQSRVQWQLNLNNLTLTAEPNATNFGTVTGIYPPSIEMDQCRISVRLYSLIYLVIVCTYLLVEALMVRFSLLGSVLHNAQARWPVACLIYCRLALMLAELCWLCYCAFCIWQISRTSPKCAEELWPMRALTAIVCLNWSAMLVTLLSVWCVFDKSGRVWLRLQPKKPVDLADFVRQHHQQHQHHQRRSSFARRNSSKQRDALVQYEAIWDQRCRRLFCCLNGDDRNEQATFRDVARLFSEFFRDLDVVPSDLLAGLLLVRRYQKERARLVLKSGSADVQAFMSGRPILPSTRFLREDTEAAAGLLPDLVFGMKLALAAYGCPMLAYTANCCCLLCQLNGGGSGGGCCCFAAFRRGCCSGPGATARASVEALLRRSGIGPDDFELLHVSQELPDAADYTPFYVGLDKRRGRLVVAIRGTMSMRDLLTDLRADAERIWPEPDAEVELESKGKSDDCEPVVSNNVSEVSIPRPEVASSRPEVASSRPEVASSKPEVASSKPEVASPRPEVASSTPEVELSMPPIASSTPEAVNPSSKSVHYSANATEANSKPNRARNSPTDACSSHSGIARAAEQVHRLLLASGWLEEAPPDTPLLLTGHSLGAGVAVVLGLRLRASVRCCLTRSRMLKVYAYSPPGGLLCPAGADASREFVTSVVVGKDAVCRLGLVQLDGLRAAMTSLLGGARQPKWRIICCGGGGAGFVNQTDQELPHVELTSSTAVEALLRRDWHAAAAAETGRPPLYPPGRILHLVRPARPSKSAQQTALLWRAVWADRADFDELLVSASMLRDHLPDCVLEALEQLAGQVAAAGGAPPSPLHLAAV